MAKDDNVKDSAESNIIDKYYGELDRDLDNSEFEDMGKFTHKFDNFIKKIDEFEPPTEDLDINIMKIILEGEQIREKRQSSKETKAFIAVSTLILSLIAGITLIVGEKFFIYFQIIVFSLMSLSLIVLALIAKKGSKLNEH